MCGFIHELRLGNNYSKRLLLYKGGKEERTPGLSLYDGIILRVPDRLVGRGIRLGGMVWVSVRAMAPSFLYSFCNHRLCGTRKHVHVGEIL